MAVLQRFYILVAIFAFSMLALTACGHGGRSAVVSASAQAQAVRDIAEGMARLQHRDNKGALAAYNAALTADPKSAVAYYDRGAIEYRERRYKDVVADFKHALALADAGAPLSKDTRFYTFLYGGIAREYSADYAGTLQYETAALALRPSSVVAHINRGYALAQSGRYHDSVLEYGTAIRDGGQGAGLYTLLGWSRIQTGNDRPAIDDFNQALRSDSRYGLAYADRGVAEADLHAYDRAIADFTRALRLNGSDAWTFDQRCDSYNDLSDYQNALYDCTRAIHLAPHFAEAFVDRSRTNIGLNNFRDGIADATAAIRYYPAYAMAYNNRGYARQLVGDIRGAFADYAMALHFAPRLSVALVNRNWLMSWVGNHRQDPQWTGELAGLNSTMMEPAPMPTGNEYEQRAQTCGAHYDGGSDYYSECMSWGLESAQSTEVSDKEQAQAAVQDAEYAQAQAQNDAAVAQENAQYNAADQEQAAQQAQQNADYSSSDSSSSTGTDTAPAPEAPVDNSGGGG